MNVKRTVVSGIGGGAIVVWVATASTFVPRSTPPAPTAGPHALEVSGAKLATEIARLHERLRPSAAPLQTRDLFAYSARPTLAPHAAVSTSGAAPIMAPRAVAPLLKLVGIAEDGPSDAVVRTAVVSGLGELFLVKLGDTINARYRVATIAPDAIELVDTSDQSTLHLALP